jgi:branched-chain amino acid transport system permease protein
MTSLPVVIERRSAAHRVLQLLGLLALVVFYVLVVNVFQNFSANRWAVAVTLAIGILGLNIVTGYSGQISIGHSAFFGIGAYTTMILIADHGWPFLATLPVAGALGFAVGAVIGFPALRIRGLYLSLITLGLALAFPAIAKSDNFFGIDFAALTGGSNGKVISSGDVTAKHGFHWNPPSWAPDSWTTNDWVFTTVLLIAIVLFVLTSNLIRSSIGRGLVAMRDNETAAAVSGVFPARYKVLAFATSALVTSIGGGCFALASTTIGPDTFGLQRSIEFIAGLVIGGVATILGPAVGGVLVEWLPYWAFDVDWPILGKLEGPQAGVLYGLILVLIIFFMPGGIIYGIRQLRARLVVFVPRLPAPEPLENEPAAPALASSGRDTAAVAAPAAPSSTSRRGGTNETTPIQ